MELTEKILELDNIKDQISNCGKCSLYKTRNKIVPGSGNPDSPILFIGEAPGANEDKEGIPFCGAAGKFLDEMLRSIGLKRSDVFVANTLKCRPPENRDPEESEKAVCRPYLEKQIEIIDPKIIVCLGKHSTETFLPDAGSISSLHGKALRRKDGRIYLPLYHPAAALHNGGLRSTLLKDFENIPKILQKLNINIKISSKS